MLYPGRGMFEPCRDVGMDGSMEYSPYCPEVEIEKIGAGQKRNERCASQVAILTVAVKKWSRCHGSMIQLLVPQTPHPT